METVKNGEAECVHFWIIDTPQGPTSTGRCKYCGMMKEFQNVWTDTFNEHQVAATANTKPEEEKTYA